MGLFIKKNNQLVPVGISAEVVDGTDVSDTTAVAADVASGKYFYTANGVKTEGTGGGAEKTITISLSRPLASSSFVSCIIKESSDLSTWVTIGTISSPTGETTVTVSAAASYLKLDLRGGYVSPPSSLSQVICTDNIGYTYYSEGSEAYMQFLIASSGEINVWNIDWDD